MGWFRARLCVAVGVALVAALVSVPSTATAVTRGTQLWASRFNGAKSGHEETRGLTVSPDGSTVFVTGSSYAGTKRGADYATVAYSTSSGAQLWASIYNGPASSDDKPASVAVSPDGSRIFVTGYSLGTATATSDYATVAYSASSGAGLWVSRYDAAGDNDLGKFVAVSPDGSTVFVTGSSTGSGTSYDYATVAYAASTGTQLWVSRYDGPGNSDDHTSSLAVGPNGSTVFVTGRSFGSSSGYDYATIAYSASTGVKLWGKRYDGPTNSDDQANSVALGSDGSTVFITGGSSGKAGYDYATVAYSASTGATLWASRYDGAAGGSDYARSLGASPDGAVVFVTGASAGSGTGLDYATVAYSASTGTQLWASRYDGPASSIDKASSLGVSPAGAAVFVSGFSYGGTTTGRDYATVAYAA